MNILTEDALKELFTWLAPGRGLRGVADVA
jgi:hypothetical protein